MQGWGGGVALGLDITKRIANALLSLWLLQSYFADEIVRHKIKKGFYLRTNPIFYPVHQKQDICSWPSSISKFDFLHLLNYMYTVLL